jgi:hypothetical protein
MARKKCWRDSLPIHPECERFPEITPQEARALRADIKKHGLKTQIAVWLSSTAPGPVLLDGRSRLDASEAIHGPLSFRSTGTGYEVVDEEGNVIIGPDDITVLDERVDPADHVYSANVHRRHLGTRRKRPLSRRAHRLVIAAGKTQVKKFLLPAAAKTDPRIRSEEEHCLCVAELRGTGGYTMFPGSVHPNGEAVTWETKAPDALPEATWDELNRIMGLLAFLAVVVRCYPAKGLRDEFCMALAGTLLRPALNEDNGIEAVDGVLELVARHAHDEEHRTRRKAAATWQKMQAGEAVTGFPRMFEILGLPQEVAPKLRTWLGIGPEADGRPIISLGSGDLETQLDRAEVALKSAKIPVFQRGRKLVRIIRTDYQAGEITRQPGSLCIEDVEPYWLSEQLQKAAAFKTGVKLKKPTTDFCNHLIIGRRGNWGFPVLASIIETPTMRRDWTVLQDPGYDPASGIYLDFGSATFGRVPEVPTRQDALAALNQFIDIIRGFPFVPDEIPEKWSPKAEEGREPSSSRSVVLSGWLAGLVRRFLRSLPLHAFDAPTMGTGKSKLADIISMIITGHAANVMSYATSNEENEKRLFAALYAGDPVVVLDNIEHPLEGAALCSILTQETWQSRLLGKSMNPVLPTNALFLDTGNNLAVCRDLTRRVVIGRLDARTERPDERTFDFEPVALAGEKRGELVIGGLTILRAYIVAGRPLRGEISHVGGFEDWTLIREALAWLDQPDPAKTRDQIRYDDPAQLELGLVMDAWDRCFGDQWMTMAQVKDEIERVEKMPMINNNNPFLVLRGTLKDVTQKEIINTRSLGWWFKDKADKIQNGRLFERRGGKADPCYRLLSQNKISEK